MTFHQIVSVPTISYQPLPSPTSELAAVQYQKIRQILQANCQSNVERINYRNPFQLLVAAILLPQATIQEINAITPTVFKKYATPDLMQGANRRELEKTLRHIGFYRKKAKYLILSSRMLLSHFDGKVPRTLANLTRLPGVARRAANLMMGELYGQAEGIVVDTRVKRVTERLGIASGKSAEAIENDLMQTIPKSDWLLMPEWLMSIADTVCSIKNPDCEACPLQQVCFEQR